MRILAIESSCDETSAAVLEKKGQDILVISSVTATSLQMHAETGGIIPENAARMQVKYILPVITEALLSSVILNKVKNLNKGELDPSSKTQDDNANQWSTAKQILKNEIDAIAVTYGPGLIGSLLVGVEAAKTLAYTFDKPIIPVNHLLAHIYANFISSPTTNHQPPNTIFPFIGLIVSGGHTDLLLFRDHGDYKWLGGTRDDAAGEAFDKVGRILGLSYPAGPEIERRANLVTKTDIHFKSPIMGEDNFDFSFSGLKTEVSRYVQSHSEQSEESIQDQLLNQICYATQKAIIDVLIKKTLKAAEKYNCNNILVGGGVSANQTFRLQLKLNAKRCTLNPEILFPEKKYSTDNGAMIGAYAMLNYEESEWQKVNANPELYFA